MDYEKLGAFYLGRVFDPKLGRPSDELLLYDAKDLTTHAVCVGMTGSGKTGLCVGLLEEAAIDGIPAIVIDPKGDLGSLLLGFPALRPADFAPWIDPAEATRLGVTPDELAASTAERWKKGLAEWGQDGARIARLHGAVDLALYTPGSTAGRPLALESNATCSSTRRARQSAAFSAGAAMPPTPRIRLRARGAPLSSCARGRQRCAIRRCARGASCRRVSPAGSSPRR